MHEISASPYAGIRGAAGVVLLCVRWRGVLSRENGHIGSGVCLGDGQTDADEVLSQGGRGDSVWPHT